MRIVVMLYCLIITTNKNRKIEFDWIFPLFRFKWQYAAPPLLHMDIQTDKRDKNALKIYKYIVYRALTHVYIMPYGYRQYNASYKHEMNVRMFVLFTCAFVRAA